MKLLFDNNLSHKLVARIYDFFPDSSHVMVEHLDESEDKDIWQFAKDKEFTIITKDSDFNELGLLNGFPPQVIWLRIGNCKIADIERIIRSNVIILSDFHQNQNFGIIKID